MINLFSRDSSHDSFIFMWFFTRLIYFHTQFLNWFIHLHMWFFRWLIYFQIVILHTIHSFSHVIHSFSHDSSDDSFIFTLIISINYSHEGHMVSFKAYCSHDVSCSHVWLEGITCWRNHKFFKYEIVIISERCRNHHPAFVCPTTASIIMYIPCLNADVLPYIRFLSYILYLL